MKQVLVVDDSRTVRIMIRQMLTARGFAVAEAENGRAAIEYCQTHGPPGAILLDVNMPVMNGLECLRLMRQNSNLTICPIVMCSTEDSEDQIAEAIAAGANEYIMKPFTEDILFDKLRQVGLE